MKTEFSMSMYDAADRRFMAMDWAGRNIFIPQAVLFLAMLTKITW